MADHAGGGDEERVVDPPTGGTGGSGGDTAALAAVKRRIAANRAKALEKLKRSKERSAPDSARKTANTGSQGDKAGSRDAPITARAALRAKQLKATAQGAAALEALPTVAAQLPYGIKAVQAGEGDAGSAQAFDAVTKAKKAAEKVALLVGAACQECNKVKCDRNFYAQFGELVCYSCRRESEKYGNVKKTDAKKQYLLTDKDLHPLRVVDLPNPKRESWHPMKVYLRKHIEAVAWAKWGGEVGLAEEQKQRRIAKELGSRAEKPGKATTAAERAQKAARVRGMGSALLGVALEPGSSRAAKRLRKESTRMSHVHKFGAEEQDKETGKWSKSCECGFTKKFEKW